MSEIDKRKKLGEEPFTYQLMKNGTVTINYKGKQIKVVKDKEAERLIARIKAVEDNILEVQLLLAKITGNFKHETKNPERVKENKYGNVKH